MRWFDPPKSDQPTQSRRPKYTVERLEEVLTEFGQWRLQVADPNVKVLITQITWGVLPYVRSQGDPPSGGVISDAMTTIEMLTGALDGYVKIQDNPGAYTANGGAASLMQKGHSALIAYWQQISTQNTSVQDITAYQAVTEYLAGNRAGQQTDS